MGSGSVEAAVLRRLDRLIWSVVAAVAAVVLASPLISNFDVVWVSFVPPAAICSALIAGAWFYREIRRDPKLASGLECTAQVIAFAAAGAPLSYLAAGIGGFLSLQDAMFDAVDRALGFDWMALLSWMNDAPATFDVLRLIYGSLLPQMALAILCLAFSGRLLWLRAYVLAFLFATLVTIAISAVLPAEGVWLHYGLGLDDARELPVVSTVWPVFTGLRDGSVRTLVALGAEGVITFPSLHAALAIIMIAALWPLRWLRWFVLALNLTMLIATPIDGSHYLIDVIAGLAIATLSLIAASATVRHIGRKPSPAALPASQIPQLAAGE